MEEEDGDWDTGPTIEEIISSVVKRKSKFGMSSGNMPSRPSSAVKNQCRESSSSPEGDQVPKSNTFNLKSYMLRNTTGAEAKISSNVLSVIHDSSTINNHERLSPGKPEVVLSSNCPENQLVSSLSNLKMQRSVSTPEVRNKFVLKSSSMLGSEHRLTDYQQISAVSSQKHINQMQNKPSVGEKENKKPTFMPLERIRERDQGTFKLASKTPPCETNALTNADCSPSNKGAEMCMESKLNIQNVAEYIQNDLEAQQENGRNILKRELTAGRKELDVHVRPSKVANTACSPQGKNHVNKSSAVAENKMTASSSSEVTSESSRSMQHMVSESSKTMQRVSESSRTMQDVASESSKNTIMQHVSESSRNMQHVSSKGTHLESVEENRGQMQQISPDNGYVSGNVLSNVPAANNGPSCAASFRTPSISRMRQMPPTPPTNHKLKKMDHIYVNDHEYLKLGILGRGGSSKVYEVLDVESRKVKAIKMVELEGLDEATLKSYENEIEILKRLQWSERIIRLHDFEKADDYLKLVMEKGNQDMASLLSSTRGRERAPISPFTIKHYWQEMLLSVQAIHTEGIIHSDLKPANFVLVNQTVKLIDFGIASSIQQDMTSVIKDSQGGTFNYMSPESIRDVHTGPVINKLSGDKFTIKIGCKSDVWSLGCILYNLVYSRTPFQHISNPLRKLGAISDPTFEIGFKAIEDKQLEEVLKLCLQFDPRKRPSIPELLQHPYLTFKTTSKNLTPVKPAHIKSAIDQLVQLTPNSLIKITSMMQQMKQDS